METRVSLRYFVSYCSFLLVYVTCALNSSGKVEMETLKILTKRAYDVCSNQELL